MISEKLSASRAIAAKVGLAALKILLDNGRELPVKELISKIEQKVSLDEWAKSTYDKSGYVRWISILHFYSIGMAKSGFIIKRKGKWFLTKEGEDAIKLGEEGLLNAIITGYNIWREKNPKEEKLENEDNSDEIIEEESGKLTLDRIESLSIDSIKNHINSLNPYEFQDLAAALLRGMGYHTPFIAPKGKDGGIDIIAYRDPLGSSAPRIKVQIKHRENTTAVKDIRELKGLLQKDGDVGIFISSSGFSPESKTTARDSSVHIELIDLDRFITLWQEFYDKLPEEDKTLLPLRPFYFYAEEK